jgi:hypothetical protein
MMIKVSGGSLPVHRFNVPGSEVKLTACDEEFD